jgi:heterogeneous nuclear rnp K-like protein 2
MSSEDVRDSSDAVNDLSDGIGRMNTDATPRTEEEYQQAQLALRAIVTSREAGVIIGKGGQNVADLRDATGVKAGVSKVVPGVHDRVFSVTGSLDQISKAYGKVAQSLLEGAPSMGMGGIISANGTHRKLTICP